MFTDRMSEEERWRVMETETGGERRRWREREMEREREGVREMTERDRGRE